MAEIKFKQENELELAKIGQEFKVWKKELEKWNENDKSSDGTKYYNLIESLKENIRSKIL